MSFSQIQMSTSGKTDFITFILDTENILDVITFISDTVTWNFQLTSEMGFLMLMAVIPNKMHEWLSINEKMALNGWVVDA